MSIKSVQKYRAQACSIRQLAERITLLEERQTLLDIAESYERLAQRANMLAKPKADSQSD
jgi:hypothetical protein